MDAGQRIAEPFLGAPTRDGWVHPQEQGGDGVYRTMLEDTDTFLVTAA
ncbi:hypothetical protein [Actinomadura madurae]|uniref:Uncharacterized protein n=1 Tax=Actinomadura madurae TaxID=1993 RepID=A0A1I5PN76_9ACTN|nr:hypothetical protein [Actinomadura madurae]SFP35475.1 hypothetical protein SAMN04489713_113195 [Actinomadura madurae]SPT63990.1 Uncharacterised protein [Actinomadura madurae]